MINGYLFKAIFALLDTPLVYISVYALRRYFNLEGHGVEVELDV
jgi:uncharacterized PurR-regulated membrane protein YhhQ (DUF165 family)